MATKFVLESRRMTTSQAEEAAELQAERFEDVPEDVHEPFTDTYQESSFRIVVQRNDFLLPNLIDMLIVHKTIEISPTYQRRARWDRARKSKLIESFLVNIPVPPVFFYESEFARYEVMDGQQRLTSLLEFFENQFALTSLKILSELNGLRFHQLPATARSGLERRYLSAIILLKESTPTSETAMLLRQQVFERLNTGGVRLNAQEVRNCVYAGPFNDLLLELSRHPIFTSMWDIPSSNSDDMAPPKRRLASNPLYRRMGDTELVLRVFALLDPTTIRTGMKSTLDRAMSRYAHFTKSALEHLRNQYLEALELADAVGGQDMFRMPTTSLHQRGRPSASLYDATMVALMRMLEHRDRIELEAENIRQSLQTELQDETFRELVVGRANTRAATIERADRVQALISDVINGNA